MAKILKFARPKTPRAKKPPSPRAALTHLRRLTKKGPLLVASYPALADRLKVDRKKAWEFVKQWEEAGEVVVERDGKELKSIRALPDLGRTEGAGVAKPSRPKKSRKRVPENVLKSVPKTDPADVPKTDVTSVPVEDKASVPKVQNNTTYSNAYGVHHTTPEAPKGASAERAPGRENTSAADTENTSTPTPELPPPPTSFTPPQNTIPRKSFIMGLFTRKAAAKSAAPVAGDAMTSLAPNEGRLPRYESHAVQRDVTYGHAVSGRGGETGPGFDVADVFREASFAERLLLLVALGLSGTAAFMSVSGMAVLFPLEPMVIMTFASLIELAKFVGASVLASGWGRYSFISRWVAAALLLLSAIICAGGVYGKLIENHAGPQAQRAAAYTSQDAGQGAKVEGLQTKLDDVKRRIGLIDDAAEGAAKRGRSRSAISAMRSQQRDRANLVAERDQLQQQVAQAKTGRTDLAARHQVDEAAALPIRYAAALFEDFGIINKGEDPERLLRWLAFAIVLTGDPMALALCVMMNSRRGRRA